MTQTPEQQIAALKAQIAQMEAQAAEQAKQAAENSSWSMKVGKKGTLSVTGTGLGRHGVALYPNQWEIIASLVPGVLTYCQSTDGKKALEERQANPIEDESAPNPSPAIKLRPVAKRVA